MFTIASHNQIAQRHKRLSALNRECADRRRGLQEKRSVLAVERDHFDALRDLVEPVEPVAVRVDRHRVRTPHVLRDDRIHARAVQPRAQQPRALAALALLTPEDFPAPDTTCNLYTDNGYID